MRSTVIETVLFVLVARLARLDTVWSLIWPVSSHVTQKFFKNFSDAKPQVRGGFTSAQQVTGHKITDCGLQVSLCGLLWAPQLNRDREVRRTSAREIDE